MRYFLPTLLFAFSLIPTLGCGDGENSVIQPTEQYQPSETEQENADREEAERDEFEG